MQAATSLVLVANEAANLQTQWRTTPLATDFDNDGRLDLVILDQEGYLTCQSRASEEPRIFIDEDSHPIRLNARSAGRSGRVKLDVVDWDSDGRLDLLGLRERPWYRNVADRDGKVVLKKIGNLARRNVSSHTTSPTACDFDQDGKPDLYLGQRTACCTSLSMTIVFIIPKIQARPPKLQAGQISGLLHEGCIRESELSSVYLNF